MRIPDGAQGAQSRRPNFLNQRRLASRWPVAHVARVIAELSALHPRLPIVFAGNRKLANAWCLAFFAERIPAATPARTRRVLERMAQEDQLLRTGRARGTRWTKA